MVVALGREVRRLTTDMISSQRGRSIRLLLYHSISEDDRDLFAISPRLFARHMDALVASGIPVLSGQQTMARLRGELPMQTGVCLTFDDGLEDFALNALPVLRAYNLPSVMFVSPGLVGTSATWPSWSHPRQFLDWSALRDLSDDRVEIGSHAYSHPHLIALDDDALRYELQQSRERIADEIPDFFDAIAYPYGDHDRRVRVAAEAAGYVAGFAVGGLWGNRRGTDRFALRRTLIDRRVSAQRIQEIVNGIDDRRFLRPRLIALGRPFRDHLLAKR